MSRTLLRGVQVVLTIVWTLSPWLASGQNCPFLSPAYLILRSYTAVPSGVIPSANQAFDVSITQALANGRLNASGTFFGIEVYSVPGNDNAKEETSTRQQLLYSRYHTATSGANKTVVTVGPDTVFRVFSISKLITVYAFLSRLGDKHWHEPVTKYIPELAASGGTKWGVGRGGFDWEEVTLGALAWKGGGLGKGYAGNDLSVFQPGGAPGIRHITEEEVVKCGANAIGISPCTREKAMEMITRQMYPFSLSDRTPGYSNVAFQLLAYAAENITGGTPFPQILKSQLIKPLGLSRTYLTNPGSNFSDAVILNAWDIDFGDEAPSAGYYQSTGDLTKLGASILTSSLLPPRMTRAWLRATSHTGYAMASLGRPWEILRRDVPVSSRSKRTRTVDLFTKQGGGTTYTSLIALAPDYGVGLSLLTAGPTAGDFHFIKKLWMETYLPALEEASRQQTASTFAGKYHSLEDNSTATIKLLPDEPGLFLSEMHSGAADFIALIATIFDSPLGGGKMVGEEGFGAFLYPMGLVERNKAAFRAIWGSPGKTVLEDCGSWAEGDRIRYGGYPGDLFIFHLAEAGEDGQNMQVTGLEVPIMGKVLLRRAQNEPDNF